VLWSSWRLGLGCGDARDDAAVGASRGVTPPGDVSCNAYVLDVAFVFGFVDVGLGWSASKVVREQSDAVE
jgi:hypothetical protein